MSYAKVPDFNHISVMSFAYVYTHTYACTHTHLEDAYMLIVTFVGISGYCTAFLLDYLCFLISNVVGMDYFCSNCNTK